MVIVFIDYVIFSKVGTYGKRNGPHGNAGYPLVVLIGAKVTLTDRRGTGTGSEDF